MSTTPVTVGRPPGGDYGRLFEPRPYWFQFAACNPQWADRPLDQWVDLFFPARGESSREAKAICAECPVQTPCQQAGKGEAGVWGGRPEDPRRVGSGGHRVGQLVDLTCVECGDTFVKAWTRGRVPTLCGEECRRVRDNRRVRLARERRKAS